MSVLAVTEKYKPYGCMLRMMLNKNSNFVPEFTYSSWLREGFCFYNPNHAAALICALVPFFWGWRRCAWVGRIVLALLCALLAVTQSRTGIIVLVMELMSLQLCGRAVSRVKFPLKVDTSFLGCVA